jgi:hypothetical protein
MCTVENVGDVLDTLGTCNGVAGGRPQIGVAQGDGNIVDGDAGLEAMRRPVGPEGVRVRVREPLGYARGRAAAPHEPVNTNSRQTQGLLVSVSAQTDEQRLLVKEPDPAGKGVDLHPRLERSLHSQRDGNLSLAAAFAAHEQSIVPRVGTRTAQSCARRPLSSAERSPQSPRTRSIATCCAQHVAIYGAPRNMLPCPA